MFKYKTHQVQNQILALVKWKASLKLKKPHAAMFY